MSRYSINIYDNILSIVIKIFIVVNLFFPYVTKISYRNCIFILSNFVASIIIILLIIIRNKKSKSIFSLILFIMLIIYNVLALVNNVIYNNYFIEQGNKSISFLLFILMLRKIDNDFLDKHNIISFLIKCIGLTLILSAIYYFFGGDAIVIENSTIGFSKQGTFSDSRLTWIYGHKSTYALMMVLFLSIVLKYKSEFKKKKYFILFIIISMFVSILIGSATLLVLILIIFFAYYFKNYDYKKYKLISIIIIPIVLIISVVLFSNTIEIIGKDRDLNSMGSRTYIYQAAKDNIGFYPHGVGKEFGNIYIDAKVVQIENFHNIFINEAFRFSITVGIAYFLLHILIAIVGGKKDIFSLAIFISCYVLFFMDYSLRTEQLSIYLFLIYIAIFNDNKVLKK